MRHLFHLLLAATLICSFQTTYAANLKNKTKPVPDAMVTAKIVSQFTTKMNLDPSKVTVSTQRGIVKLSGEVIDKQTFVDAFWLAKTTPGVKMVDVDDLDIKRVNTVLSDAYITAKVETSVLKAKILDDESIPLVGINATTANGIVTITGEVKRHESITAILKRAHAIRGVKKIISCLYVKGELAPKSS